MMSEFFSNAIDQFRTAVSPINSLTVLRLRFRLLQMASADLGRPTLGMHAPQANHVSADRRTPFTTKSLQLAGFS